MLGFHYEQATKRVHRSDDYKESVSCSLRPAVFLQVTGDFVLTLGMGQTLHFRRRIQEVNNANAATKLVHSCQGATKGGSFYVSSLNF